MFVNISVKVYLADTAAFVVGVEDVVMRVDDVIQTRWILALRSLSGAGLWPKLTLNYTGSLSLTLYICTLWLHWMMNDERCGKFVRSLLSLDVGRIGNDDVALKHPLHIIIGFNEL